MSVRNDHIVIVGSGFAGLGMAIRLKQSGIDDFTVLERADRVGGVWRDNTYPGVACDVPAHLYSFSFAPNPGWSRLFAPQREILAYLDGCAERFGVKKHIRFNAGVVEARFDDATGLWEIKASDGSVLRARVLVSGAGHALTVPVVPTIPGVETFKGKTFHSARWDHSFALEGKRVAVIGTGASAIQIVPSIVSRVAKLTVFQRTAPWIVPKPDRAVDDGEQRFFARRPGAQKVLRGVIYSVMEALGAGYVVDPRVNALREGHCLRYMKSRVKDPVLREKLTPTYRMGCKRVLFSSDYYDALVRPNAALVTEGITAVRENGVVTADGELHEVDAIVFATGFEAADAKESFPLVGSRGVTLKDEWKNGMEAYLGTAIAGFPNLFMLVGPNTGLGHNSMVYMIESQVAYVLDAIKTLRRENLKQVEVTRATQDRYNQWLQRRMKRTVWNTGCQSWYVNHAGKNTTLFPGFTWEFRLRTRRFEPDRFALTPDDGAKAVEPSRSSVMHAVS